MNSKILSVHIDNVDQSKPPVVTVAIDKKEGLWMALRGSTHNPLLTIDHLIHLTSTAGIAIESEEACKLFPNLPPAGCENLD